MFLQLRKLPLSPILQICSASSKFRSNIYCVNGFEHAAPARWFNLGCSQSNAFARQLRPIPIFREPPKLSKCVRPNIEMTSKELVKSSQRSAAPLTSFSIFASRGFCSCLRVLLQLDFAPLFVTEVNVHQPETATAQMFNRTLSRLHHILDFCNSHSRSAIRQFCPGPNSSQ